MSRFGGVWEWLVVLGAVAAFGLVDWFGQAICAFLFPGQ